MSDKPLWSVAHNIRKTFPFIIIIIIIIIITSYAPISSKIKLSGATKPRG